VQSPIVWSDDPAWKLDYCNVDKLTPAEIAKRRAAFDEQRDIARSVRATTQG
jgi:hypothetical protein